MSGYIGQISKTQVYIAKDIDKVSVKVITQERDQYLHLIHLLGVNIKRWANYKQ